MRSPLTERRRRVIVCAAVVLLWIGGLAGPNGVRANGADAATPPDASAATLARDILNAAGVRGGLVVHVGCGRSGGSAQPGALAAALRAGDAYVVHGLAREAATVEAARATVRARGAYGPVSVDRLIRSDPFGTGPRLPYVDNLVSLLVAEDPGEVPIPEVMRVLAPGGVAMVGGKKIVKPRPAGLDEWTHFLHGPDNNAVAADTVVGPPRRMQWLAAPTWTRHHGWDKGTRPAVRGVVSAGGRLFYMVDEATAAHIRAPSRWVLLARDAFNGVQLWRKPLGHAGYPPRLEQLWRTLVTDGDRLYAPLGPAEPLSALDAATGEVIRTYPETEGVEEVIASGGTLFVVTGGKTALAVRAGTGQVRWRWTPPDGAGIVPLTLAASGDKVFVKTDTHIECVSAETGQGLWRFRPKGAGKRKRLRWPRAKLIATGGVVLCSYGGTNPEVLNRDAWQYLGSHPRVNAYGGTLAALSAEDGRVLWTTAYKPGLESYPGDVFVIGGRVWLGPDFAEARDLHTGRVRRRLDVLERLWTTGHHHRCYPEKATTRYILNAKRGVEMMDLTGSNHSRNNWVRGTCRVGVVPCNGLLYAPPHSCGCYMEAKLYGFWALAAGGGEERPPAETPAPAAKPPHAEGDRLERGPAYGAEITNIKSGISTLKSEISETAWPTYRHDAARSGSTAAAVPADPAPLWRGEVGGRLSPPVVAGGRVLVAEVDAHRLVCLDAQTGREAWTVTAGGRIDSPPTVYRGRVLAGSADGRVTCLRLSDGALLWRFRAAPADRRAVAMDQVESLWPVPGSVLVLEAGGAAGDGGDGAVAYVAAGRSSYLDGGLWLYGLDPCTGRVLHEARVRTESPNAPPPPGSDPAEMRRRFAQNATDYKTFTAPDRSDAFSMAGARRAVLVADGDSVYLRHLRFDRRLVRQGEPRPHLFSTSSLLDGAEIHRSHWVLGTGDFSRTPVAYSWIAYKPRKGAGGKLSVPYGLMLAFDASRVWGVRRNHLMRSKLAGKGLYALFGQARPESAGAGRPDFREDGVRLAWTAALPLRPRAMVRAGRHLLIAGMPDAFDAKRPSAPCNAAFEGEGAGVLHVASADDGRRVGGRPLEAPPVWDGLAVTPGRLYLSLTNGTLVCLGAER